MERKSTRTRLRGANIRSCRVARGYTLLELLLVLAVLASLMALTWPALTRRLSQTELREAAMDVAEAMTDARLNAMESGEPWVFRYWPETGQFEIGPLDRDLKQFAAAGDPTSSDEVDFGEPGSEDVRSQIGQQLDQVQADREQAGANASRNSLNDPLAAGSLAELLGDQAERSELPADYLLWNSSNSSASQDGTQAIDQLTGRNASASPFTAEATASGFTAPESSLSDQGRSGPPGAMGLAGESTMESLDETEKWSAGRARWIIFDPLGQSEDLTLSVHSTRTPWKVDIHVRGVTGNVSLGDPVRTMTLDASQRINDAERKQDGGAFSPSSAAGAPTSSDELGFEMNSDDYRPQELTR